MNKCTVCGAVFDDSAMFCSVCGAKLVNGEPDAAEMMASEPKAEITEAVSEPESVPSLSADYVDEATVSEVIETEEREDILPRVNSDTIDSYIKVMTICAKYLTLSNAIPPSKPTISELAKKYINDNIGKRIVIGDICDALKCSKSTLLTSFKRQYGITINTYITDLKLSIAQRMLSDGDKTINEIACELGFSDQSYFSKVFSTKYGIPPSEYRMGHKTQNTNYQGDN